jgi:hypothetical protein
MLESLVREQVAALQRAVEQAFFGDGERDGGGPAVRLAQLCCAKLGVPRSVHTVWIEP